MTTSPDPNSTPAPTPEPTPTPTPPPTPTQTPATTPTLTETQRVKHSHYGIIALIIIILIGLLAGGYYAYTAYENQKTTLQNEIGTLNVELNALKAQTGNQSQVAFNNVSLTQLYNKTSNSVVMIEGFITQSSLLGQTTEEVQGSGFVYNYSLTGEVVVITNYHVVDGATDISVTFKNGNAYTATVLGHDVYSDLAVLAVNAPPDQFKPLNVTYSSLLNVGDPVIAIGNPFGLTGSMTTGSVSALGRTITENTTDGYAIPDIIQFSAPINPGNSGGPLLDSEGNVVGITTAIVENSQGLGFAIPSDTIIRELATLIDNGTYEHSWIGVEGTDMNYYIANAMNTNITYGWLITSILKTSPPSPAQVARLREATQNATIFGTTIPIGGDIIVAMNGTRIINGDALSTYLEENTQPYNTLILTVIRNNTATNVTLTLGFRPQP
jgi:S1-C subfamily serine protease